MRKLAALLPIVIAVGIVAALAVAGSSVPSTVTIDTRGAVTDPASTNLDYGIAGRVDSAKAQCISNRTVRLLGVYFGEPKAHPFDTARTGSHGGFNGIGPSTHNGNTLTGASAVLEPKRIGSRKHPKKCTGDEFGPN